MDGKPGFLFSDLSFSIWGLAVMAINRAYHFFFDDVVSIWDDTTQWMISEEDARNGFHKLHNSVFSSTCNGCESNLSLTSRDDYHLSCLTNHAVSVAGGIFNVKVNLTSVGISK